MIRSRDEDEALDAMFGADQARRRLAALIGAVLLALMLAIVLSPRPAHGASAAVVEATGYSEARCRWMGPFLAEFGLPVETFKRISWRESGCAFRAPCVADHDDLACSRFGLNFKGGLAARWRALCGARSHLDTRWFAVDMTCAREAYERMGLAPWR